MSPSLPQRTRKYIDTVLQNRLIGALVAVQVLVLCAAGVYLWIDLHRVAEDALYQVHMGTGPRLVTRLMHEGLQITAVMLGVQGLCLAGAARWASGHLAQVLAALHAVLRPMGVLQFDTPPPPQDLHPVVTRCVQWQTHERARHQALDQTLRALEALAALPHLDPDQTQAFDAQLRQLCERLPGGEPSTPP